MSVFVRRVLLGFFVLLLLGAASLGLAPGSAAQSGLPCEVTSAPDDGFTSAGFGLTRQELDAQYGAGEAIQSGWYYEFDGFAITLTNCDLILDIDPDGEFADPEAATGLVRNLLPEDAVLAGAWEFGTIQSLPQDADEWVSAELAVRYRLLGEPRTGSILVLYTYAGNAMSPGPIDHIELRSALIPV